MQFLQFVFIKFKNYLISFSFPENTVSVLSKIWICLSYMEPYFFSFPFRCINFINLKISLSIL